MLEFKANYGGKGFDNRCPMCQSEEDTTEHILKCNKGQKKLNLNDERRKEFVEIIKIYRKNKKNRSIDNIQEEQNMLEEQKKREDSRRRQKLRDNRMR